MSASESPDSKSTPPGPSSDQPSANEPESGEIAAPAKAAASRISQAPTVCGEESDLDFAEKGEAPEEPKADEKPKDSDSDGVGADRATESKPAEEPPEDPLEVAKAEAKRIREQLIRTAADFDNYKKRARREQDDAGRRGKEGVLKDLLPIFDNLERAAGHADKTQDVKSLSDGLRMVLKQFEQALERIGITKVISIGKPFDPTVHEAIQHLESTEYAAGVVMTEVQSGYQMDKHLLRACMVVVSRGPGPEAADAAGSGGDEEAASDDSEGGDDEEAAPSSGDSEGAGGDSEG